jgi:glucose-6-phosphate 1-dehydrogenase
MEGSPVELRVCQHEEPDAMGAYERLLTEAIQGDATDFAAKITSRPRGASWARFSGT